MSIILIQISMNIKHINSNDVYTHNNDNSHDTNTIITILMIRIRIIVINSMLIMIRSVQKKLIHTIVIINISITNIVTILLKCYN